VQKAYFSKNKIEYIDMQIKATSYTPSVIFNEETRLFAIEGRSFPENAKDFYIPILEWLKNYSDTNKDEITFRVCLEYFNTASSKFLLEMLNEFVGIQTKTEAPVKVEWVYVENDEDMKEAGQEYEQIVSIPFTFIEEREQ